MWDDVIIGKGDKGTTAIKVFAIEGEHSISENRISYWINDCILDIGMTIFKDTKEGIKLSNMISQKQPVNKIYNWLNQIAVKKINHKYLLTKIDEAKKESFEMGKKAKQEEILNALGV